MKGKAPIYVAASAVVILVVACCVAVYLPYATSSSKLSIKGILFTLGEEERSIELLVKAEGGAVEVEGVLVNGLAVEKSSISDRILAHGGEARYIFKYPWRMGEEYNIRIDLANGAFLKVKAKAPVVEPNLKLEVCGVEVDRGSDSLKVRVGYKAEGNGTTSLHVMLFVYSSFNATFRNTYIFYDPDYMADEAIRLADALIEHFNSYGVPIYKLNYYALETMCESIGSPMKKSVLILVYPLKDSQGRRLFNVLPAPLLDPNGNGLLRDDSKHGKSRLYDMMFDEGLVLVTVGSLQPHKRILYRDGSYSWSRDYSGLVDVQEFLAGSSSREPILRSALHAYFTYSPTRISGTLGLSMLEAYSMFDGNALERQGLKYYAYGDYTLPLEPGLNLAMPIFIRVGRGGWLAMADESLQLSEGQLAHDLFLVWVHAVWNSEWIPYGWYWDSGCSFYSSSGGLIKASGMLESEAIPLGAANYLLVLRVVGIASCSDTNSGLIIEELMSYEPRERS
ncbi:MAG: hypothetical protein QW701_07020 [Candidatus Nezhaarchaeales archaeon]